MNLFAWHQVNNYGDKLGPALFHLISKRPVYIESRGLGVTFDRGPKREIHCFLGTLAQQIFGPHKFVFWGFGVSPSDGPSHHGCRPMPRNLDIDFRAVRGRLSRQIYEEAGYSIPDSIPYGDPGLLVPYFYPAATRKVNDFCLIPHHSQYEEWRDRFRGLNIIDLRAHDYGQLPGIIQEITRYRAVFTSSLHAAILAESFGIPVRPVEPLLAFKFDDFYSSIGKRPEYIPAVSDGLNWESEAARLVDEWEPPRWDPLPWLASAPFEISSDLGTFLSQHYDELAAAERPPVTELASATVRLGRSSSFETIPESLGSSNSNTEKCVFHLDPADFQGRMTASKPLVERIRGRIARSICDGLFVSRTASYLRLGVPVQNGGPFALSGLVSLGGSTEAKVVIDIQRIDGECDLLIQNSRYETIAERRFSTVDGSGRHQIQFWPHEDETSILLLLRVITGSIQIGAVDLFTSVRD